MQKFDVSKHMLVPKHSKVSEKEKKEIFEKYAITLRELPRIHANDPAIHDLDAKEDDVIKIVRQSASAGECVFYRRVVRG